MIQLEGVTFAYPRGKPVFEEFSWRAARGEAWAVIGPSGCGKSTLLYLLAGLRQPDAGIVAIAGQPVTRPRPETGLILQDHGLLPWATVADNARLGLTIRGFYGPDGRHAPRGSALATREVEERIAAWLERLGIAGLADQYPAQISGGQRQRTAIARTLALEPDLLLMDEPFSALDAPTREDLQNLTVTLRQEASLTTVIVTHNIEEAVFLGKHILVLGEPPNRTPHVIANPDAGDGEYRADPAYLARVDEVRAALGDAS
jgi:ABC-type nitrate/sulfonate/bicarbonate transport system ATPase subunit